MTSTLERAQSSELLVHSSADHLQMQLFQGCCSLPGILGGKPLICLQHLCSSNHLGSLSPSFFFVLNCEWAFISALHILSIKAITKEVMEEPN